MTHPIAIIDYQLSNLKSVEYACLKVGLPVVITTDPQVVNQAPGLILPGVGAFGDAMATLIELGLASAIKNQVKQGIPLMGVCLGLQLLFTQSEEFGHHQGLDLIPGQVKKFPDFNDQHQPLKIPQIAWNQLESGKIKWTKTAFKHLQVGDFMYFIHSYYVIPNNSQTVLSTTTYAGFNYCSSINHQNILAVQFHPEKSGAKGIEIYRNWAEDSHLI